MMGVPLTYDVKTGAEMYEGGASLKDVSGLLGGNVGRWSVLLRREGVKMRSNVPSDETRQRIEDIRAMRLSGKTLDEIAAHYSISRQRVHQILNPDAPRERKRSKADIRREKIIGMIHRGLNVPELAEAAGITESSALAFIRRYRAHRRREVGAK